MHGEHVDPERMIGNAKPLLPEDREIWQEWQFGRHTGAMFLSLKGRGPTNWRP